jgi:hypothetical protein
MSYSFSITAKTKDEAGLKVEAELAKVVDQQRSHSADRQAAQDAAEAFIDVLADPGEGEEIFVSVNGSVAYYGHTAPHRFTSASVSVNASIQTVAS